MSRMQLRRIENTGIIVVIVSLLLIDHQRIAYRVFAWIAMFLAAGGMGFALFWYEIKKYQRKNGKQ